MNKEYIDKVANSIIAQLEQGTAPWLKPWEPGQFRLPFNPTTGKEYRGMNSLWLHMQGKDDPRWLTFNQGKAEGASVRKGEKGTHIVYWKFTEERTLKGEDGRPVIDETTGKEKKITVKLDRPRSFMAVVFNASQFDGLPPLEARPQRSEPERHALAEKIIENSGAKITHIDGDRAFYSPSRDSITLPARNQFPTADNYYATALHELGHWTGHHSRLDRDLSHPFGSEGYAREELRAEISSLMLGERMDIGHDPGQHAAYIGSWIKVLKEDPREIFRAAADAERIAGFIMGFENERAQTVEVTQEASQEQQLDKLNRREQSESLPRDPREIPENAQFPKNWGGLDASFIRDAPRPDSTVSRQQPEAEAAAVLHHRPEKPMPNRIYLAVPYAEKEQAKAAAKNAGFKLQWDKDAKSWYAPEGADLSTMQKWNPDSSRVITETAPDSPQVQLADALRDAGFEIKRGQWLNGNRVVDSEPIMDGQLYRVPVKGDRDGQRSGAYAAHMQGQVPGAYIENLKTGERINWKADGPVEQLTAEDRARLAKEAQERQSLRDEATQRRYEATADAAAALWAESPAATADNAYCKAKGITNPVGLRVVPDAVSPEAAAKGIVIAKTAKEAKGQREKNPDARVFKAGDLLIPGRDMDGKMWTLQSVNPYFKSLMKGGRKHGLFSVAGADADGKPIDGILKSANQSLVLAEGYATADTVARLSGEPVIVAFDSGNLNAVAGGLRERFPNAPMVIAADNDHDAQNRTLTNGQPGVNVGLVKAKEAAERHGAGVAAPSFPKGDKGTDWNDVEKARGENEARKMLAEQMAVAKRDAAVNAERMTMLARERDMEARNDPTTNADDADVATERSRAASLIAAASDHKTAVNSTVANALATGAKAPSASAAKAATDRQNGAMRDTVKQERQDVQYDADNDDKTPAKPAARPRARRSRGHDAGM